MCLFVFYGEGGVGRFAFHSIEKSVLSHVKQMDIHVSFYGYDIYVTHVQINQLVCFGCLVT